MRSFYKNRLLAYPIKGYRFSCLYGSKEKVKLCKGGGETAGEEREASASATGAQGEKSSGISISFIFILPDQQNIFLFDLYNYVCS